jgi:Mce-associated membrane protein
VTAAGPNLYDLLDVDSAASDAEIRTAWKASIADLDPSDRRFRVYNQAAEVLLDPQKRAAYDAELAAAEAEPEPEPEAEAEVADEPAAVSDPGRAPPSVDPVVTPTGSGRWVVPTWLLIGVGVVTLLVIAATAYFWTQPSDSSVEDATRAAQSAAERAIVPVLSYDAKTLDDDQAEAQTYLTSDYRKEYDKVFAVIKENAPETETAVSVEVVASGIVRSGEDRVEVLLFVNRPTTNKKQPEPVVYKDQVRITMQLVDGDWLIDDMTTSPVSQ